MSPALRTALVLSLYAAMGLALMLAAGARNQQVYDYRLGLAALGPGPARPVGSLAPDVALPRLPSFVARGGKPPVLAATLSAYRGRRVVVLLLTGYT